MVVKTDKELLALAAKAAGVRLIWCPPGSRSPKPWDASDESNHRLWNPLERDGDAFRLAVKLHMEVAVDSMDVRVSYVPPGQHPMAEGVAELYEPVQDDPYAATRRAIVRAAADMASKGAE